MKTTLFPTSLLGGFVWSELARTQCHDPVFWGSNLIYSLNRSQFAGLGPELRDYSIYRDITVPYSISGNEA
jgi:hypothetical protein